MTEKTDVKFDRDQTNGPATSRPFEFENAMPFVIEAETPEGLAML
jgi:hypothetical protein